MLIQEFWELNGTLFQHNFQYDICIKEKPLIRRGILSIICSLFGFVSPVT